MGTGVHLVSGQCNSKLRAIKHYLQTIKCFHFYFIMVFFKYLLQFDSSDTKILLFATRSFGDLIGSTIGGDAQMLSMGFFVVFIYIVIMLGK